jgi:hypothetical protein
MLNVALVALLTAFQTPTPAEPELKGQACTARELVGTWQFTSKPSMPMPGITTVLKHITPTHFLVVRIGAKDVVTSAHGGPYTLANGIYTETLQHGFGELFEKARGASVALQCRLNEDMLHIVGEIQGTKIDEQWRRATGTSGQR